MNTVKYIICVVIINCWVQYSFGQIDGHSNFIDTLSHRWHVKGNAKIMGYGIQSQPYVKDSITIQVRFGDDYSQYEFKGQFMDSLLSKNRFLTDEDEGMKTIIKEHKIIFPPPPYNSH